MMPFCLKHGTKATFGCKECWYALCKFLQTTHPDAIIDTDNVLQKVGSVE